MPKGGWWFVKKEIPQEWIENVMSKTEYFDIINLHFVYEKEETQGWL